MRAVMLTCLLAAVAPGQVVLRAVTSTGLVVTADGASQSLPPGTDVTAGVTLTARSGSTFSSGTLGFATTLAAATSTVACTESASAATGGTVTHGPHAIDVVWTAPVAIAATLRIDWCSAVRGIGTYSGTADVVGYGQVQSVPGFACVGLPSTRSFAVTVGPSGLRVVLAAQIFATSSFGSLTSVTGAWLLTLTPSPSDPCAVQPYGTACGARLLAEVDLRLPGKHVVGLTDSSRPGAAWLLVGTQQLAVGLPNGCFVHNEVLIVLPFAIAGGMASVVLDPLPFPGIRFTAQGATFEPSTAALHLSNGLALACR